MRERRPDCTVSFEGKSLSAVSGEPLMVTLVAHGIETASRSVKYHRPRGAFCMAGSCGQCWMRIEDLPNRAACMTMAHEGLSASRENAFPSADFDVFRGADLLFESIDHHRLGTTPLRPLNKIMQDTARRMAGLGELSSRPAVPAASMTHRHIDVAVIGGGPAGLAAALAVAVAGVPVLLIESRTALGGQLRTRLFDDDAALTSLVSRATDTVREIHVGAQAVGVYPEEGLLLKRADRLELVHAKTLIICTGGYEQSPLFESNDLPGHYGARAFAELALLHGVVPAKRVVIADGGTEIGPRLEAALKRDSIDVVRVTERVTAARGGTRVKGVEVESGKRISCDAIASATKVAPAFELARQAGCGIEHRPQDGGFAVVVDRATMQTSAPWIHAAGDATGAKTAAEAMREGDAAGRAAVLALRGKQ